MEISQWLFITLIANKLFHTGFQQEADKRASTEIMQQLNIKFKDVFTEIVCFNGTFLNWTANHPMPHEAYTLQKPCREELE